MVPLADDALSRFESFAAGFRTVFQRADQALRFRAYLRGLLEPSDRKNVGAVAAAAAAVMMTEADLAQALQHFVSHSPWDHRRLLAAVRRATAPARADPAAVWVVHDGVFQKKGRHSVGVQRQFARALGRKVNCQVGVFVAQVGPAGYFPLAARLYLPAGWLRENAELAGKTIPDEDRRPLTKAEVALSLIDELAAEGESCGGVAAEEGYRGGLAEALAAREPRLLDQVGRDTVEAACRGFERLQTELGIDHFEGRTWHGWHHHVSLVFTAFTFLATEARAGHSRTTGMSILRMTE